MRLPLCSAQRRSERTSPTGSERRCACAWLLNACACLPLQLKDWAAKFSEREAAIGEKEEVIEALKSSIELLRTVRDATGTAHVLANGLAATPTWKSCRSNSVEQLKKQLLEF
uniref:Uncharacterized protein n=1 Tax=Chrysotila carterae TaxID=13221 RepID=A0A7S4B5T6_CHRCT